MVVSTGKAMAERRRLDYTLVGKLLVRRRNNGETGGCPSAMGRQSRRLGGKLRRAVAIRVGAVALCRLLL